MHECCAVTKLLVSGVPLGPPEDNEWWQGFLYENFKVFAFSTVFYGTKSLICLVPMINGVKRKITKAIGGGDPR